MKSLLNGFLARIFDFSELGRVQFDIENKVHADNAFLRVFIDHFMTFAIFVEFSDCIRKWSNIIQ